MMEKEIPVGWKIFQLSEIVEILDNMRIPINSPERAKRVGSIPYYGATGQTGWIDDFIFNEELILLGEDGAPFFDKKKNVAYIIEGKSWVNNHAHVLKAIRNKTMNRFVYYFLNQLDYSDYVGGTTRLKLTQGNLKIIPVPLPPLHEQQRIVAKLDALFGHLDSLKEKLNRIPELLKNFRQQVLTQAVTGKLTREWRKGKDFGEWETQRLEGFSQSKLGKMLDQAKNKGELIDYLRNINVRWFEIDFNDLNQMRVEKSELHKYELEYGDILICEGGEPGRAAMWKNERNEIIFQKALHRVRLNDNVLPEYFLFNLFIDASTERLNDLFTGTTIKHLTGRSLAKYQINIPSLVEQTEIVKKVKALLNLADKIESQYQSLKAKIDQLPQAILAKAFRGELVGQEVN